MVLKLSDASDTSMKPRETLNYLCHRTVWQKPHQRGGSADFSQA